VTITLCAHEIPKGGTTLTEATLLKNSIESDGGTMAAGSITKVQLVDKYHNQVYRFCISLACRREDADDLFQDTFLYAFSHMAKLVDSENPLSFLISIAAFQWKSRQRRFARRNRIAPSVALDDGNDVHTVDVEDEFLESEELRVVRCMVRELPEKLRVPVIMYYMAEMSVANISKALKLPEGTVKSHLFTARNIIKKGLSAEYGNK